MHPRRSRDLWARSFHHAGLKLRHAIVEILSKKCEHQGCYQGTNRSSGCHLCGRMIAQFYACPTN